MKKFSILLPLAAVALFGLGCNPFAKVQERVTERVAEGVVERAIEGSTGGKVDVDVNNGSGAVTFKDNKTGDYTAFGEGAKIPDNFPSDVPRYSGAKTLAVSLKGDVKSAGLTQQTTDSFSKVTEWIGNQMKSAGFEEASTMELGDAGSIRSYEKGSVKISVTVTWDDEDKVTTIVFVREES